MNRNEWITFCDDFSVRFPSDFEWLDARPKTLELWFHDVFSGLGLEDCLDVSRRLFRGNLPKWKYATERDTIPATYQREVGKMRVERRNASAVSGYRQYDRRVRGGDVVTGMVNVLATDKKRDDGKSMLFCFRRCLRMKDEGATLDERNAYVGEYFG